MVSRRTIHIALMAMGISLASCDATIHFYPVPDEPDAPAPGKSLIRLNVDWSRYGKTVPTGMTVICHHTETGECKRTIDNTISHVTPYLSPGRHWVTVFNLTEGEFGNIGFRGLDAMETAEAYATPHEGSKWYTARADGNSYVAGEPEWLAVDTIMSDHVEPLTDGSIKTIGTLYPRNIIHTLHVSIHTENISNLRSVRAAISGLASGRMLSGDKPNDNTETVTHLIESGAWTRLRTSTDPDIGIAKADLRCFGLPGNHLGSADENTFELQTMLADGKVLRHEIPVGHLITSGELPPGLRGDNLDLYLVLAIALPPAEKPLPPDSNDGDFGFDAWVNDWAHEDVPVPF